MKRIFSVDDSDKFTELDQEEFNSEKTLQNIIENKISSVFKNLIFIKSEFNIESFYTDTLAYDNEKNCFVIIEYKNNRSKTLLDQIFSYYGKLNTHPDKFAMEYISKFREKNSEKFSLKDFNLEESYVIIISSKYTIYQKMAIEGIKTIKGLYRKIKLYKISKYDKGIIILDDLIDSKPNTPKYKAKITVKAVESISFSLTESAYLNGEYYGKPSDKTRQFYRMFKDKMTDIFDELYIDVTSVYISFFLMNDYRLCTCDIRKNKIIVCFDIPSNVDRKYDLITDAPKNKWGIGKHKFDIKEEHQINKIVSYLLSMNVYDLALNPNTRKDYEGLMEDFPEFAST